MHNQITVLLIIHICLTFCLCPLGWVIAGDNMVIGGPCEYQTYRGTATIISITAERQSQKQRSPVNEKFEVRFVFYPAEEIDQSWVQVPGKEFVLFLTNGWLPNALFLQKYGIEVNQSFDCDLKVISKGSCTPLIFDFPTIDLSDYLLNK